MRSHVLISPCLAYRYKRGVPVVGLVMLLAASGCGSGTQSRLVGNAQHGEVMITRMACGSCHAIPGIAEADGNVGPPLSHFARRTMVAGVLPNTPDNLVEWIRHPQTIVPGNAMPDSRLTERQARDVAAYLESLH
ncbi:MAG TPA: c-type cytochrome [Rhizomicrobium sp.]|jgi:cytochrome c1